MRYARIDGMLSTDIIHCDSATIQTSTRSSMPLSDFVKTHLHTATAVRYISTTSPSRTGLDHGRSTSRCNSVFSEAAYLFASAVVPSQSFLQRPFALLFSLSFALQSLSLSFTIVLELPRAQHCCCERLLLLCYYRSSCNAFSRPSRRSAGSACSHHSRVGRHRRSGQHLA